MNVVVLADLATQINREHAAAIDHGGKAIAHALNVGELLLQSKEQCQHGQWLPWLREHVSFSERTAQGYMRLAQRPDIRNTVADMSLRMALEYAAKPGSRRYQELATRALEDDLIAWLVSGCPLDDRAFDEIMHKHGICDGKDEWSSFCLVCHAGAPSA